MTYTTVFVEGETFNLICVSNQIISYPTECKAENFFYFFVHLVPTALVHDLFSVVLDVLQQWFSNLFTLHTANKNIQKYVFPLISLS